MMTWEEFRRQAFDAALQNGCDAAESYFVAGDSFSVQILDGDVDKYDVSRTCGFGLRVQVGGKNGYAYTEVADDPAALVRHAMDNAAVTENNDEHPMQGACEYVTVTRPENRALALSEREKIELALDMERRARALDPRVKRMGYDLVASGTSRVEIHNTKGLCAVREEEDSYSFLEPIMEQDGEMRDGGAFRVRSEMLDVDSLVKEAVEETAAQFGAKPVPAGTYDIVLRYDAAADLLSAFSSMFSADMAQKGLSLLAGREGETVAASCVDIIDDPLYSYSPRAFDDEGTPSVTKTVVEKGVLKTLLHNLKTAKKAGVESTSNASRSASSPVSVAPSNFYIPAGERDLKTLLTTMGNGLLITTLEGTHAGVNPVSGDFSLSARGFVVEDGKIGRPVERITVAGSFIPLLSAVQEVGCDLKFGIPGDGSIGSPSLFITGVAVSGQA
ncbi:MAG: TldD/PmbA family protein [Clostridia bacterium]|nr:TldD/PmbA family protein [Clostridia bacterium]